MSIQRDKKMATKNTSVEKIQIPALNLKTMKITIEGLTPLIFHRWSEKAKEMILAKQTKQPNKGRDIRDPEQEFQESLYRDSKGNVAFPALSIKQAIVDAGRNVTGVTMTLLRGAVRVEGDKDGLIPVKYAELRKREDMVRVGMGIADLRYRGEVTDWSMDILITWNDDVLSASQVINLLNIAGFSCGLGEWRPQRNGDFGTFTVKTKDVSQ